MAYFLEPCDIKKIQIGLVLIGFPGILLSKYYCRKVARYSQTSNICQNLPKMLMIRRVRVGSAKLTRRPCPTLNQWGWNQGGLKSWSSHKFFGFVLSISLAKNSFFQKKLLNKSSLKKFIPPSLTLLNKMRYALMHITLQK